MIYDEKAWALVNTEEIRRQNDDNKRSNAYLMHHKQGKFSIWIVNIHLKAFGGMSDFFAENPERDNTHVTELGNIIGRLLMTATEPGAVPDTSKPPIYLCGDFNNPKSKLDLVQSAVRTVHDYAISEPDPGEEEAVSLASFGSQTTHSRRGTKERASKRASSARRRSSLFAMAVT